jgi:hypothetical protein
MGTHIGMRFGLSLGALLDVFACFDNCLVELRQNLILVEAGKIAACLNVFSVAQSIDPGPRTTRDVICSSTRRGIIFEGVKEDQLFLTVAAEIGKLCTGKFGAEIPLLAGISFNFEGLRSKLSRCILPIDFQPANSGPF